MVGFVQPHGSSRPSYSSARCWASSSLSCRVRVAFRTSILCEQSAPLFGRELARAKALVPCVIATLAAAAYVLAAEAAGLRDFWPTLLITFSAVIPSTLTALCATIRMGTSSALYVVMACTAAGAAFALIDRGRSFWGSSDSRR